MGPLSRNVGRVLTANVPHGAKGWGCGTVSSSEASHGGCATLCVRGQGPS